MNLLHFICANQNMPLQSSHFGTYYDNPVTTASVTSAFETEIIVKSIMKISVQSNNANTESATGFAN
jgi:DNA gyrase inhibitor GyrI